MMKKKMKVCVFCSANGRISPDFFRAAEEVGRWAALQGHSLVYGGVSQGLMERLAQAAKMAGGRTIGVIPTIVEKAGRRSDFVDVELWCDSLSDRKQLMMDQADVFVALPGGIGTLDEVFTVVASATIGYHDKRLVLYDVGGFWNPLVNLLNHLQQQGMVRGEWSRFINVVDSIEGLEAVMNEL